MSLLLFVKLAHIEYLVSKAREKILAVFKKERNKQVQACNVKK